ncbi:C-type lectin domain family 4 member M-like [Pangasianodon hypophthalmus]|uniref:C-type lectin domain family 4 member M-like n=1 Tax=Pangasianodon hypophthalmus TaxID=310915 RepID=UPI0023073C15|nr:C-type lectin domain family 4 member M-like [Pangasianodon hypophthalmus]
MEMSEDIYANTEVAEENRADSSDSDKSYEDVYMNEDNLATRKARSFEQSKSSGNNHAGNKCYRLTAVCPLLLCVLLLTAITVLWIKFNSVNTENNQLQTRYSNLTIERDQLKLERYQLQLERDQSETSYNNLTIERDQLKLERYQFQTSYHNLAKERDQLQTSYNNLNTQRDQLQTSYKKLTKERDQLQTSYNNLNTEKDQLQTSYNNLNTEKDQLQTSYKKLTKDRDQLQTNYNNLNKDRDQLQTNYNNLTKDRDQLQKQKVELQEKLTKLGWIFFSSKPYYISSERKTWTESRQDCRGRGADLMIINSKEEQDFVENLSKSKNYGFYIGLSDLDNEGVFKWVDGTSMTTAYWSSGNGFSDSDDCVVNRYEGSDRWFDRPCTETYYWICE